MTKDEAMKLALEAAYLAGFNASGEGYNGEYPFRDHNAHPEQDAGWMRERDKHVEQALAEQPAQQAPDYAWPTVADYERDVGFETNQAFRMAWNMARTTNKMLGHTSPPAQRTWVGLTEDEISILSASLGFDQFVKKVVRCAEAKLKEKNT